MEKIKWNQETIKALRKSHKLTQAEFAGKIGCRPQTISEWEIGKYTPRSAYNILLSFLEADLRKKSEASERTQ